MKKVLQVIVLPLSIGLSACSTIEPASEAGEPATNSYTEPRASGLKAHNAFPNPDDVCVLLKSNSLTKPFESENHFLIACPKHEKGAIGDRKIKQRAEVVGNARHWVLMRVPVTQKPVLRSV